jgi:hypothetical protein
MASIFVIPRSSNSGTAVDSELKQQMDAGNQPVPFTPAPEKK